MQSCDTWSREATRAHDKEYSRWEQTFPSHPSLYQFSLHNSVLIHEAPEACIHFLLKCSLSHCHCHQTLSRVEFSDILCCRVAGWCLEQGCEPGWCLLSSQKHNTCVFTYLCRTNWVCQSGVLVPTVESRNDLDIMLEIKRPLGCELFPDIYAFWSELWGFYEAV